MIDVRPSGLSVTSVSFAAGAKQVLRGVSLRVNPGETTAVVGPSGCGKSTLLRVIAGLERPDCGRIDFDGVDQVEVAPERRQFGMMFQEYSLFPHLDVAGNVGFGLRYARMEARARTRRVEELLELTGLRGFERRRIASLSGGEKQRVALARTLATAPRLVMLDEPLGALDRTLRDRLIEELRGILRVVGVASIYVTHDQAEAFAIADTMVMMRGGEIVRTASPAAIYREPETEFVARFLGMTNIVDGQRAADGTVATSCGTWTVAPGEEAAVRLLLRDEGARMVEGAGPGIASGTVASVTFLGRMTRLALATPAGPLAFDLVMGPDAVPPPGSQVHVAVPNVQMLEAEEPRNGAA